MNLGHRKVGPGHPCFIVAEVGLSHDGSLNYAHSIIDAIADTGADAVKFQLRIPTFERKDAQWRIPPKYPVDQSRWMYWRRTALERADLSDLRDHAARAGLIFLCSPFSPEAVRLLDPLVPAWKIPSGEITNEELLSAVKASRKPAILSTGMCTQGELENALQSLHSVEKAILQCTSMYPTPPDRVGLRGMVELAKYGYPVGLSDHSGTVSPSVGAVALGASIVEVHVTFDRRLWSFDVEASITIDELSQLVTSVRHVEEALKPVGMDEKAKGLQPMRELFMGAK